MRKYLSLFLLPLAVALSCAVPGEAAAANDTPTSKRASQAAKPAKGAKSAHRTKNSSGTQGQNAGTHATPGSGRSAKSRVKSRPGSTATRKDKSSGRAAEKPTPPDRGAANVVPLATPAGDYAVPVKPLRPPKPVVNRMYAIDGDTFFHNGKKIRVRGVDTPEVGQPNSELTKQRLQQLLDSGEVTIEPTATDDLGRTVATVRVNGRDVAEQLRAEGPEKPQQ